MDNYIVPVSNEITVEWDYELLVNDDRFCYPFSQEFIDIVLEQGGRGTRKTWRIIFYAITLALNGESTMVLRNIAGTNYGSVYADFIRILDMYELSYTTKLSPQPEIKIFANNGKESIIMFRGMDNTQKLKGSVPLRCNPVGCVWFEEALEMLPKKSLREAWVDIEDILQSFRDPQIKKLRKIFSYNPKWKGHWLYDINQAVTTGQEGYENYKLNISTIYDNPFLPDYHIKGIEKYKTAWIEQWQIMGLGEFADVGDRVYNNIKFYNQLPDNMSFNKINIGVDVGVRDATTFVATGFSNMYQDVHVLENYANTSKDKDWSNVKKDLMDFTRRILSKYQVSYIELHMEYSGIGKEFLEQVEYDLVVNERLPVKVRTADKKAIHDRIMITNFLFSEDRLFIKDGTPLAEEMKSIMYDEKDNRMDFKDHNINGFEYSLIPEYRQLKLGLIYTAI